MTKAAHETVRYWIPLTVTLLVGAALLAPQLIETGDVAPSDRSADGGGLADAVPPSNAVPPSTGDFVFDYSDYAAVLTRYTQRIDGISYVDYAALTRNRPRLDRFVTQLERIDPQMLNAASEQERMALWINAYNGLTLRLIVDNYPIQATLFRSLAFPANSIRQISGTWDDYVFNVAGRKVSLNDIEHQILRRKFAEPLIHMALNCASMSCPSLRDEPYVAKRLREQLKDQARIYLLRRDSLEVDVRAAVVKVSTIFDWYGEDLAAEFGSGLLGEIYGPVDGPVLGFVARYGPPNVRALVSAPNSELSVEYQSYNWSLNDRPI